MTGWEMPLFLRAITHRRSEADILRDWQGVRDAEVATELRARASTYPLEIVQAECFVKDNPGLKGDQLNEKLKEQTRRLGFSLRADSHDHAVAIVRLPLTS
jgi:uncharacterized protein DUF3300